MDLTHNVLWKVSLSNGETLYESKGNFVEVEDELSPWQKLIKYTAVNGLEITSLSLYTRDGRTFNLPSAGKNPRSKAFADAQKPLDYNLFRFIAREHDVVNNAITKSAVSDWFTVVEAIYPDYKLQIWVDEQNTRNSWVVAVK